ncbi:citrate synthase [Paraburkholderia sp. BL27I4N3]|uniref:citryl-CoA lyase n=1 Tax=Paraburkholderia sp. BL27I4N3 TaxID=1938805 RepID=UPI000E256868|nr:citryl-CoA lyase [Paraburkholderia sp. BL27I4N3]REE07479.1 citrate synthase [Paraburkholderia sp. BL27I4N3]
MNSAEIKNAYWNTGISDVEPTAVHARGYDVNDLMGRVSFATTCYLVIRGKLPTPNQERMLDALLNSTIDYGLKKPGTAAARYCVSGNPNMQAGLATAVLSAGEYTLAPEDAGKFIIEGVAKYKASGQTLDTFATAYVAELRARKARVPGFGHPNFKGVDPRSERLKNLAMREGIWGESCDWYEAIHRAFKLAVNKPDLPINDVGMTAALFAQLGFSPAEMTGIAVMATLPGVIAHITEEMNSKVRIRTIPDETVTYERTRRDLEADLKSVGW